MQSIDYVVSPSLEHSEAIATRLNSIMGFPDAKNKTDSYAKPQEHDSEPGKYLLIIKPSWSPKLKRLVTIEDIKSHLNLDEVNSIKNREQLKRELAFHEERVTNNGATNNI